MKKNYDPAELEIILFGAYDVITASTGFGEDEDDNGAVGGGGFDPGGWD